MGIARKCFKGVMHSWSVGDLHKSGIQILQEHVSILAYNW